MSHQGHENEAFMWENLADLCSGDFSNSANVDMTTAAVEMGKRKGEMGDQVVEMGKRKGEMGDQVVEMKGKAKKGKGENGERREVGQSSSQGMHIVTERERRKKMRDLFSTLQSLVPNLSPRADKSTVLEEATKFIKDRECTLRRLEKQKLEKLQGSKNLSSIAGSSKPTVLSTRQAFVANQVSTVNKNDNNPALPPAIIRTWTSPNVVLNVCGDDAQYTVYTPKKPGLFANICSVFDKHRLDTFFAHISSDANRYTYMIQARMAYKAPNELPDLLTKEERYRLAAEDIAMCVLF